MKNTISAPRMGACCAVPALALAGSLSCALAEGAPPLLLPEAELAPVTVSALGGLAVPYDQTGVSVSVLDIPELKKQGVTTLNGALATVPGVSVQPGGLDQRGNISNISIRGMSSGQYTLPMLDGMRLYCFSNGANITPNIVGRTDLFSLGRVELLRGSQGALYGAGAMGGVLFMETPEGQGEPSLTLFAEAGSFDSCTGNAIAQGKVEKLAYFISATHERTNNDIAFADGRPVRAKHAGHYEAWNEALRLDYDLNKDNKLTLTWRREDAETRNQSPVNPLWGGACLDYSFRSNLITARLNTKVDKRFSTSLMAGYYGVDNMLGRGYNLNLRNVQIEWRNLVTWNEHNSTTAGLAWNRSDFRTISSTPGMDDTLDNTFGLFAEHVFRPVKNQDYSLALRHDQSSVWDACYSLRAAGNYRFNNEHTRAFASVGSGYKTPSALQCGGIYDVGYGKYVGNPGLDCEQALTAEVGLEQQVAGGHYVEVTLFQTRVDNGIAAVPTAEPGTWSYENRHGHWTSRGMELCTHGMWEKGWKLGYRLSFTLIQPHDEEGRQLNESTRQQWSAELNASPTEKLTTGIGLSAAAGRRDYNGIRLDNYCVLRCFARYQVSKQLCLHLRVENLTDERFISNSTGDDDQNGAILNSGAAVYGGVTFSF